MDFERLSPSRRTVRRFRQIPVPDCDLEYLIEMARFASCGANRQQLRYVIVRNSELVRKLFDTTAWAALVAPSRNPVWGINAPVCFIAVTAPGNASHIQHADAGAAIQTIQLAAWEREIGCCWLASFDHDIAEKLLDISPDHRVLYLVAIGYPDEKPVGEDAVSGNTAYYLDENDQLHVPKLPAGELITWM